MSEEVQDEAQEEEITLTDEDLAVIDEVENLDDEGFEIENTEPVEASTEPEVSSDEVSTTDETQGQTFNPDLVQRAGAYGLDPNGFASQESLQYVLTSLTKATIRCLNGTTGIKAKYSNSRLNTPLTLVSSNLNSRWT